MTTPLPPNAFEAAPFRGGAFHNASGREKHGLASALRWLLTRSRGPWPTHVEDVPVALPVARVDDGSIRATVIGHATVLVHVPRVAASPGSRMEWTMLLVAVMLSSSAALVAGIAGRRGART